MTITSVFGGLALLGQVVLWCTSILRNRARTRFDTCFSTDIKILPYVVLLVLLVYIRRTYGTVQFWWQIVPDPK